MSLPSSRIRPSVGCSKPAIIRSVVVLPQPDGPSIEKNSPLGIVEVDAVDGGHVAEALDQINECDFAGHPVKSTDSDVEGGHVADHAAARPGRSPRVKKR